MMGIIVLVQSSRTVMKMSIIVWYKNVSLYVCVYCELFWGRCLHL